MIFVLLPLAVLAFWIPLLLSLRATRDKNSSAHRFLLIYWLLYAVSSNVSTTLQMPFEKIPLTTTIDAAVSIFNVWLFYGHGCLVVSFYVLPGLFSRFLGFRSLDELDQFLSPVIFPLVNGSKSFAGKGVTRGTLSGLSILDYGVNRFCYMDLPPELHQRYLNARRILRMLLLKANKRTFRRRSSSSSLLALASCRKRSDSFHNREQVQLGLLPGPAIIPNQKIRQRIHSSEGPSEIHGLYGVIDMGDSWGTFRTRAVSDGEIKPKAQIPVNNADRKRHFQVRELNNTLFVPQLVKAGR